jgi:predicted Fe-S protein YdhL (DUF1289 family)
MKKTPKIPTIEKYLAFDGAHSPTLWEHVPESWRCPGCGRSKFEIMRWTNRKVKNSIKCSPYKDWMAVLHRHHDHAENSTKIRFDETVICHQCNIADAAAKKKLNLDGCFSFSPSEIRRFVKATPHSKHQIDYNKAREIYEIIIVDSL